MHTQVMNYISRILNITHDEKGAKWIHTFKEFDAFIDLLNDFNDF